MPQTARKLLSLLAPQDRWRACLLLIMVVVMALLDMIGIASILPFMKVLTDPGQAMSNHQLAFIYDHLGFSSPASFLAFLGLTVFLLLLLSTGFKAFTTYHLLRFSQMQEHAMGRRLVTGYLHQPYEWFLSQNSADLGKTVLSEVIQVINGSVVPGMQLIAQGTVASTIICLLFLVNAKVAAISIFGLSAIYAGIYLTFRRYLGRIGAERIAANRLRFQVTNETFSGIKDIKVGGLENIALDRFDAPAQVYARHQTTSQLVGQLPKFALEIVALGGMLLLVVYAANLPGGLAAALPLIALYGLAGFRLLPALQLIYAQITRLRFSEPALDRLYKDMTTLPVPPAYTSPDAGNAQPMPLENRITLSNITYRYPNAAKAALDGITLHIPAYTLVGFVGVTGSGKTTTMDVLLGLLTPQSGQIMVDGILITPTNVRNWQRAVGYVPQQVFLADDTVEANIAFGIPASAIDKAAIERAARIANLHDFVISQLPQGYLTRIGERGVRLSGGQRQRIGIARALYHDPQILFLDEATSALDNLTEQGVMDAVHNLGHQKTIVVIAHRLSTIRKCDQIYLFENGRVVAQGTFDELIVKSSLFNKMAASSSDSHTSISQLS